MGCFCPCVLFDGLSCLFGVRAADLVLGLLLLTDDIILGEIFLNLTILMFLKIEVEYKFEKKKICESTKAVQEFRLNKLKPTKPSQSD